MFVQYHELYGFVVGRLVFEAMAASASDGWLSLILGKCGLLGMQDYAGFV